MSIDSPPPRPGLAGKGARYRWAVLNRVLAAMLGGYALTALATATLSLLLPRISTVTRAEAVLTATLWSFVLYTVIVIWVFYTRSGKRAWTGLCISGLALGALFLALRST